MKMERAKKFDLEDRLLEFTLRIITIVESLPDNKVCNHLGGQLLRSGTSPALNYGEAQASESKKDFIHKFKLVLKELRETLTCLKILNRKSLLSDISVLDENRELIAIFAASIKTAKARGELKS
jgi:four helix bundle protein